MATKVLQWDVDPVTVTGTTESVTAALVATLNNRSINGWNFVTIVETGHYPITPYLIWNK